MVSKSELLVLTLLLWDPGWVITYQAFISTQWLTVYPKKYAHGCVVFCFVVVMQSFIMNPHDVFIHIHQGYFAGTGAIVRLPQWQWSKPDGYGKISQCITTTKHSKAKTVCIFLGINCIPALSFCICISDTFACHHFSYHKVRELLEFIFDHIKPTIPTTDWSQIAIVSVISGLYWVVQIDDADLDRVVKEWSHKTELWKLNKINRIVKVNRKHMNIALRTGGC